MILLKSRPQSCKSFGKSPELTALTGPNFSLYLIGGYNKNKIKNEKQKKFSFCVITYQFRAKLLLLGANLKGRGSVKKIIDLTFLCLAICRGCRGILQEKDSKNETVCIIMYS